LKEEFHFQQKCDKLTDNDILVEFAPVSLLELHGEAIFYFRLFFE
jgi:hypothetical protein